MKKIYAKSPRMVVFDFDKVDAPKKLDNEALEDFGLSEDELPF